MKTRSEIELLLICNEVALSKTPKNTTLYDMIEDTISRLKVDLAFVEFWGPFFD